MQIVAALSTLLPEALREGRSTASNLTPNAIGLYATCQERSRFTAME